MASQQFLIRNRHQNQWYGRVIIPVSLREHFNGKRELRKSLGTSSKRKAKCLSLSFWLQCQTGFARLSTNSQNTFSFADTKGFIRWLGCNTEQHGIQGYMTSDDNDNSGSIKSSPPKVLTVKDALGNETVIDFDDPEKEAALSLELQRQSAALIEQYIEKYKDEPELLARIIGRQNMPRDLVEINSTPSKTFDEVIELYLTKLKNQGRKGKLLSPRTLDNYVGRLLFWQEYFQARPINSLTRPELGEIQDWLPFIPPNYKKRRNKFGECYSTLDAIAQAKEQISGTDTISTKTLAEYLGQLKALLEFSVSRGYLQEDLTSTIEMPNAKRAKKAITRLPFTEEDLQKIFPVNYGEIFGTQRAGLDQHAKYWFPLIALYSGARLEEIAQLQTSDIKTCPDTSITYMMIDNEGAAADGKKKHTKNLNSVRPIPIHRKLIELGFLDYMEERKRDKSNKGLFKLNRDKQGRLAKGLGNWFSRFDKRGDGRCVKGYIENQGVKSKGTNELGERWSKSFHSFRHTVIDNLRGKKMANGEFIREQDIALVVGHEKNKRETANYGADRMQLELRQSVIDCIDFKIHLS